MPEGVPGPYRGPQEETTGFLLHDVTDDEFLRVAVRAMHVARQQLETGDAGHDRTSARFFALLAAAEVEVLHAAQSRLTMAAKAREMARRRIGSALGLTYDADTKQYSGKREWAKETGHSSCCPGYPNGTWPCWG